MKWIAESNFVSQLFYSEKKELFGEKYNLYGYEYYSKGIFSLPWQDFSGILQSAYIDHFDWRSRHGANQTDSPYFDEDDSTYTGWLTSIKDQGLTSECWAFSSIGPVEANTNLFFNQHLDYDLSEQDIVDNSGGGYFNDPLVALDYVASTGVVTEYCFPFQSSTKCQDPDTIVQISDGIEIDLPSNNQQRAIDTLKKTLIEKGPLSLSFQIGNWAHAVTLNGFATTTNNEVYWIYKDSYGNESGENGFKFIYFDQLENTRPVAADVPVNIVADSIPEVLCKDEDGDGYYFWGIGEKPENCPQCPDTEDCDDSNPNVGPFNPDYSCNCLVMHSNDTIFINSNTSWNNDINQKRDVVVQSGTELTITAKVAFAEKTRLIVRPGGRLIIDGGKLTKACDENWRGIEVWGNPDTTQGFTALQGFVMVENGGSVENAQIVIITGKRNVVGNIVDGYEGGIVHAFDAKFINNNIDVKFLPYQNMHPYYPGLELANVSSFENCDFITDYSNNEYIICEAHVELNEVKDIRFEGCTFKLNSSLFDYSDERGTGILSYNSSFRVKAACTSEIYPCPEKDSSLFYNLSYGIRAFNDGESRIIRIEDAVFDYNRKAMYLSGFTDPTIISNKFRCIKNPPNMPGRDLGNIIYGMYLDGCTGYHVENNEFFSNYIHGYTSIRNVGLFVMNSGTEANQIYNNMFHNSSLGLAAFGENRGEETGLCINCNDFWSNLNDVWIFPDTSKTKGQGLQGIDPYQGDPNDTTGKNLAGNTFTYFEFIPSPEAYYNMINNQGCEHITYVHHMRQTDPHTWPKNINDTTQITLVEKPLIQFDKSIHCPSTLEYPGRLEEKMNDFDSTAFALASYENELSVKVDGGETNELNSDVLYSQAGQSMQLRQQLLDESPYLSDTVLRTSIYKENVLPNAMLRDILVANPQSAKSGQTLQKLNERTVSMPDYMMGQIMQGVSNIGAREILESGRNAWNRSNYRAFSDVIRICKTDTSIVNARDSLLTFLQGNNKVYAKYRLAMEYLANNDFNDASAVINNLQTEAYSENISLAYTDYIDAKESLNNRGMSIYQMDSTDVSGLRNIMDRKMPLISAYARNTLVASGKLNYSEPLYFPSILKTTYIEYPKPPVEESNFESFMRLYPVPAREYCIVEYIIPGETNKAQLQITDPNGRIIKTIYLIAKIDQQVISLNYLSSGIYIFRLLIDNTLIESQKISIIK